MFFIDNVHRESFLQRDPFLASAEELLTCGSAECEAFTEGS